jgi:hypothetical protein
MEDSLSENGAARDTGGEDRVVDGNAIDSLRRAAGRSKGPRRAAGLLRYLTLNSPCMLDSWGGQ